MIMPTQNKNWYAKIAVAVLVVALITLSIFLVRQYRIAARQGIVSAERIHFADIVRRHSLGAADVALIAPWMTFDYISVSYKVPVPYLASVLNVSSSTTGYPNITIAHYARTIATSSTAFTIEVQNAIKVYLSPQ
jgi:hypothetical protein